MRNAVREKQIPDNAVLTSMGNLTVGPPFDSTDGPVRGSFDLVRASFWRTPFGLVVR